MSSFYHEPVPPNLSPGPYPHPRPAQLADVRPDHVHPPGGLYKPCSVKGCSNFVPLEHPHKMCEVCRGRHRVYAMTKRAKRKKEKAVLTGSASQHQTVAWMPPEENLLAQEADFGQSSAQGAREEFAQPLPGDQHIFEVPESTNDLSSVLPNQWDPNSLDPRLFSQASELAGALTLSPPVERQPPQQAPPPPEPEPTPQPSSSAAQVPTVPEIHSVLSAVLRTIPNIEIPPGAVSGPTASTSSSAPAAVPPRFCSIKGCKTLILGGSFYKMCEPCRDRYRDYGTKKRAKSKRSKEAPVKKLNKARPKDDARQAEQGAPEEDDDDDGSEPESELGAGAQDLNPISRAGRKSAAKLPPRLCSVSHCREVLPAGYQYLRCERHRLQNRHHSKLKRVRDKDQKAQAHDEWSAATLGPRESTEGSGDVPADSREAAEGGGEGEDDGGKGDTAADSVPFDAEDIVRALDVLAGEIQEGTLLAKLREEEEERSDEARQRSTHPEAPRNGEAPTGEEVSSAEAGDLAKDLPPAVRGLRRENHICSVKSCRNLLSPSTPWKMCDMCRERDRKGRRLKALRDSGQVATEGEASTSSEAQNRTSARQKERRDRGKGKGKQKAQGGASADASVPSEEVGGGSTTAGPSGCTAGTSSGDVVPPAMAPTNFVFVEPMLSNHSGSEPQQHVQSELIAGSNAHSQLSLDPSHPSVPDANNAPDVSTKRKARKGKAKDTSLHSGEDATNATPESATSQPSGDSSYQAPEFTSIASYAASLEIHPSWYHAPVGAEPPYPYYMPQLSSSPPYAIPPPPGYPYDPSLPPPMSPNGPHPQPPPAYPSPDSLYSYSYALQGHPYPYPSPEYAPSPSYAPPPQDFPLPEPDQPLPSDPAPTSGLVSPLPPPPAPVPAPTASEQPITSTSRPHANTPLPPTPPPSIPQDQEPTPGPEQQAVFYSTFSVPPQEPDESASNNPTPSSSEPSKDSKSAHTFIVRTSAMYENPDAMAQPTCTTGSRPAFSVKRKRGADDSSPPKKRVSSSSRQSAAVRSSGEVGTVHGVNDDPEMLVPSSSN